MRLQLLVALGLFVGGSAAISGCATSQAVVPPLQPQMITFNGKPRMVMADPIEVLKPGDEVLVRHQGSNAVAVVAAQRGPGVYKLRNLDFKLLTVENYAGRLFNAGAAWQEAQAAKKDGTPPPATESVAASVADGPAPAAPSPLRVQSSVPKPNIEALAASPKPKSSPAQTITASDLHADLLRLDELRKRGILTDSEFQAAKERLLLRLQ